MTGTDTSEYGEMGLNVLLVEDEADIRGLMRFCLEDDKRCATVTEASATGEAIHIASTGPFM